MIKIFFGFWRKISFIITILALFFVYTSMPDTIAVKHNEAGAPIGFISKQSFFYIAAGIILGINLLMAALKNSLLKLDYSKLNQKSVWANSKESLDNVLLTWIEAFLAITNTFLVFCFFGLNSINSKVSQKLDFNYNWGIILATILLGIFIFYLPLRLLFTNPKASNS